MKSSIFRWRRKGTLAEKEIKELATLDIKNYYRNKQAENRRNVRLLKGRRR
ncbi:MAG: hypothetical protein ACFFCZ_16285 [Promethearchaeota archaeon]